ncbi:protein FAM219A isoform X2 [Rhea pennata]
MLGQPALPEQPFPSSFKEKAVCQPGSPSYQLSFAVLHGERNTKHVTSKCHDLWDPTAASISDRDCDTREGETVAMNYKPSPLQVKLEKQRELARKGSLKNGNMGSPVNQQPKKNNVMARTRLVVPNKGYSSLDQSPDEKPLVALDTDSDDDFDMSRYSSSGYSSAEINQDLNIQLLKDGYRLDEIPDDEDLDLIPPKSVNPTCMCCQATSSTACHIQ